MSVLTVEQEFQGMMAEENTALKRVETVFHLGCKQYNECAEKLDTLMGIVSALQTQLDFDDDNENEELVGVLDIIWHVVAERDFPYYSAQCQKEFKEEKNQLDGIYPEPLFKIAYRFLTDFERLCNYLLAFSRMLHEYATLKLCNREKIKKYNEIANILEDISGKYYMQATNLKAYLDPSLDLDLARVQRVVEL